MEFIQISVEYPSGIEIDDSGSYDPDSGIVYVSERLALVMARLNDTEPPPRIVGKFGMISQTLELRPDGHLLADGPLPILSQRRWWLERLIHHGWTKEQRLQFGRFCHGLTVASVAGFVGFWHSTHHWTFEAILNELALAAVVVVTFVVGMISMNGE